MMVLGVPPHLAYTPITRTCGGGLFTLLRIYFLRHRPFVLAAIPDANALVFPFLNPNFIKNAYFCHRTRRLILF
jgi:hypothetical protein